MKKKGQNKVSKVMEEYASGELKSSSGKRVTDKSQALAIGYSEERRKNKKKRKK